VAKGTIARLIKDRGYGFIATEDGKDVFFETEEGPKGPRAANIRSSEKTAD